MRLPLEGKGHNPQTKVFENFKYDELFSLATKYVMSENAGHFPVEEKEQQPAHKTFHPTCVLPKRCTGTKN